MEAKSSPASPASAGSAPPPGASGLPALGAPKPATPGARTALGLGAATLALVVAFAGYRLYEKDRAETAAELVRINAYLAARAQAESTPPERKRPKPPAAERVASAAATHPPPEPAAAAAPKPRAAKARPPAEARPKAPAARAKPPKAVATAAPEAAPVRTAERPKSVDRIWRERTARECAEGFLGLICREWLKLDLCRQHDAWGKASICPAAEKPPPAVISGSAG